MFFAAGSISPPCFFKALHLLVFLKKVGSMHGITKAAVRVLSPTASKPKQNLHYFEFDNLLENQHFSVRNNWCVVLVGDNTRQRHLYDMR
jgi:hypothetical protein